MLVVGSDGRFAGYRPRATLAARTVLMLELARSERR
jgi:hypothetical protein